MGARGHIENTLARYAWTMDRDLLDEIGMCFTTDARVYFDTGATLGREAVVAELRRRRATYREAGLTPWHVITTTLITDESEHAARARSFFLAIRTRGEGPPVVNSNGYYDDRFVVEADVWRISERRVMIATAAATTPNG